MPEEPLSPTPAVTLGRFAARAASAGVPTDVEHSVSQRVIDVLGLCIAAQSLPTSRAILAYVEAEGGPPEAIAIGLPTRISAANAALANGVLAHSLDYDDTHLPSVLHPSAPVVPAALAAAQRYSASGSALTRAVAVGLEVTVRLGMAGYDAALRNSVYFEHGQHATSICGTVGAAVAASMLAGHPAPTITHSIGIAASMAAGIIESNRGGGTVKRLHCGWAAQAGVRAATLADAGFTGPPTVLEGRFGFFEAFLHGNVDLDVVTNGLGADWAVPGIFFKPYPANHFTHTTIDAARRLRERGITPEDVAEVTIGVAEPTVRTIGEPAEIKRRPDTGYQAQFSAPYTFVAGLLGGSGLGVGLPDFTDELAVDPQRRDLMRRVTVVGDERCNAIFPHQFPAIVRLITTTGEVLVEEVMVNRGGSQDPLTDAELEEKFAANVGDRVRAHTVSMLLDRARKLTALESVDDLLDPLGVSMEPNAAQQRLSDNSGAINV